MKYKLLAVLTFFCIVVVNAQVDFNANPTGYIPCPTPTVTCNNITYTGNLIRMRYSNQGSSDIEFHIRKCDNTNFTTAGTAFIREGNACGSEQYQNNVNIGNIVTSVFVPINSWHSGPKTFYAVIESLGGSKSYGGSTTVTKTCPDYEFTSTTISSISVAHGNYVTVSAIVKNVGNVSGNPDKVKFYLSTNTILDQNDVFLAQDILSNLSPNGTESVSDNLLIPLSTSPGGYYILYRVDPDNISEECEEFDNGAFAFINVIGAPDLINLSPATSLSTVCLGGDLYLNHIIGNNGTLNLVEDFHIKYYLSSNQTYNSSDIYLGEKFIVQNISVGNGFAVNNYNIDIPSNISPGTYYILIYADKDNVIVETNDLNNVTASLPINVIGHPVRTYPLNNNSVSSLQPTFTWNSIPGVNEYGMAIRNIFNQTVYSANTGSNTYHTPPVGTLNPGTTYKWVALANLPGQQCTSAQFWDFHTPCADNFEPNNSNATPNATAFQALGNTASTQNISAYLISNTDIDSYKFSTSGPGTINLNLSSLPGNYDLELWYYNGTNIATSVNTGTTNETITFTHNGQAQDFVIKIYSPNGNYDCSDLYNLSLIWTPNTSGSFLELNAPINFGATNLLVGQTYTLNSQIKNYGSTPFSGNLYLKVNNSTTSVTIALGISIPGNGGIYNINLPYIPLANHAGNQVPAQILYQIGGAPGVPVSGGILHDNPIYLNITNPGSFNLRLKNSQNFDASTLIVGNNYNYTTQVENVGGSPWTGSFYLKVNNTDTAYLIAQNTIPVGDYLPISYSFAVENIHLNNAAPVEIYYQTNHNGSGILVPQHTFLNPRTIPIVPVNANCTNFGDVNPGNGELYLATKCLCELGYISPQQGSNNVNPSANLYRADLAKLVYFLIHKGNNPSPSDFFPVPFDDLQQSWTTYFRYAKDLSYLEYSDGVAPFDRDKINFRPYDGITRKYALKVLLEALNIAPDNSEPSPCPNYGPSDEAYGYIKEAFDLGWFAQSGAQCNPHSLMTRGDIFLILYRVLNTNNATCDPDNPIIPNSISVNDYFIPGNFTSWNMARNAGYTEGYFSSYSKTSFEIPGVGLNMSFSHSYNSKLTELPKEFMPIKPLGEGWSHNYNAYMIEVPGWTANGETHPPKTYTFWPDGSIHMYDKNSRARMSIGVYDTLTAPSTNTYQIKSKNQTKYTFTKFTNANIIGGAIWMLTEIRDINNNKLSIVYQEANNYPRINYVIDDANRKLQFAYDSGNNNIFSVQDIAGNRIVYFGVNANGNLSLYKNARNFQTNYQYHTDINRKHLLTSIILPEGNSITNVYNVNRKLTSSQVGSQKPTLIDPNHSFSGPDDFVSSVVTDPDNVEIESRFNINGQVNNVTLGGNGMTSSYDSKHITLPSSTTYNGYTVSYEYDDIGNIKKVTLPGGIEHKYTWTTENDLDTYIDPNGGLTDFGYDNNKNLDFIKDPMNFMTDYTIATNGLLTSIQSPLGVSQTMEYNLPSGDLKKITNALGHSTTMTYDGVGRMKTIQNPKNQITQINYNNNDHVDRVTNVVSSGNIITKYVYNKNDLLKEVENGRNFKTLMEYTNRDLLETMTFGDDQTTYTYRNDNLLDNVTKPNGSVFHMEYDNLGRIINDGFATYTYDNQDEVLTTTVNGQNQTLTLTYDGSKRLETATYDGKTITYDYDLNGNVKQIIYPGNSLIVNYEYDPNNRMKKIFVGSTLLTEYFYRNDGLLDSVWNSNGTNERYKYDAAARLIYMDSKKSTGAKLAAYDFTLDEIGNHSVENKTEHFEEPTFISQTITSSFNGENEINNLGGESFAFNDNGAQTQKGATSYTWNNVEQMTGIPTKNKIFVYDANGLLRQASRNGVVTKYVWDIMEMGNLLMETDNNGNATNYYIYGNGLIARRSVGGVNSFYHSDFRGSTIAISDDSQNITHKYQYDAFGAVLNKSESNANPFQFVGKYGIMYEGDSLSYIRARWYDGSIGRFLSEDPVWNTNLYVYGNNNPINNFDLNGKFSTNIHHTIINNLFTGNTREKFIYANDFIDGDPESQGYVGLGIAQMEVFSHYHAMRQRGESVSEAKTKFAKHLKLQLDNYAKSGDEFYLGLGIHSIVDYFSPEHSGFQEWNIVSEGLAYFNPNKDTHHTKEEQGMCDEKTYDMISKAVKKYIKIGVVKRSNHLRK